MTDLLSALHLDVRFDGRLSVGVGVLVGAFVGVRVGVIEGVTHKVPQLCSSSVASNSFISPSHEVPSGSSSPPVTSHGLHAVS